MGGIVLNSESLSRNINSLSIPFRDVLSMVFPLAHLDV